MNWINLRTELLRTPEFMSAKDGAIETWLRVLAYCCEQENGGSMTGSNSWSDKVWTCAAGVSKQQVIDAFPLIKETESGYVIVGYPQSKQAEVEAKREAGRKGGSRSASRSACRSPNGSAATEGEGEGESKGKEKEKKNPLSGFDAFWDFYPRKVKKSEAQKSWVKERCWEQTERILKMLPRQIESPDWTKEHGKFIPHPTTYLNQHRWEDEPSIPTKVITFSASALDEQIEAQRIADLEFAEALKQRKEL